jgi:hypothetical protein
MGVQGEGEYQMDNVLDFMPGGSPNEKGLSRRHISTVVESDNF